MRDYENNELTNAVFLHRKVRAYPPLGFKTELSPRFCSDKTDRVVPGPKALMLGVIIALCFDLSIRLISSSKTRIESLAAVSKTRPLLFLPTCQLEANRVTAKGEEAQARFLVEMLS